MKTFTSTFNSFYDEKRVISEGVDSAGNLYQKIYAHHFPITALIGDDEPRVDELEAVENSMFIEQVKETLTKEHGEVVDLLLEGYNFNQISKIKGIKQYRMYQIKSELQEALSWLRDGRRPVIRMV